MLNPNIGNGNVARQGSFGMCTCVVHTTICFDVIIVLVLAMIRYAIEHDDNGKQMIKKMISNEFEWIMNRMNSRFRSPHNWAVNFKSCPQCCRIYWAHRKTTASSVFIELAISFAAVVLFFLNSFLSPFLSLSLVLSSACYESIGCCEIEADELKERKTCNTHDKVNWLA